METWKIARRAHQLPVPPKRPLYPRKVKASENELLEEVYTNGWDEGKIAAFVGSAGTPGTPGTPGTQTEAWSIGPHSVILCSRNLASKKKKEVVEECGKLWDWLGVSRPFTLILWWREDPRIIGAKEWPSKASVNGGWTSQHSSVIYVYRSEEWDRVFIHEMIHALGWDWKMPETPLACWGLPPDSYIVPALFEAWTELYAEWLWCIWHQIDWEAQRSWQDFQAIQILVRYRVLEMETWQENTSVFAYYILKTALAPHIAELLLFGNSNSNSNSISNSNGNGNGNEQEEVLCRLVRPGLDSLAKKALLVDFVHAPLSLRMSLLPRSQK